MNTIQQVYRQARDCNDRLETEALRQLQQTDIYHILPPDWDRIVVQQEQIEQALGLPVSRQNLREATDALLDFALTWMIQHGTAEQATQFRHILDLSMTYTHEPFLEACMNLPENQDPSPVPAFIQELATFFQQQEREAEEALCQNYALHEAHLAYLEHALTHIQADRPEEAEIALLCFSTEEAQRLKEQAKLLAILGRQERSPHAKRQDVLVRQLTAAFPSPEQPCEEAQE